MSWARLDEHDYIVEITTLDPNGRFADADQWIETQQDIFEGWFWNGEAFEEADGYVPPVEETIRASLFNLYTADDIAYALIQNAANEPEYLNEIKTAYVEIKNQFNP